VDVWVAQGTVELAAPDGGKQVTVSTGHEPLQVMRYPPAPDAARANAESAESLTALLNFIPMANQKLKALAARAQSGEELTATEKDYIGRVRQVTSLIKLATANAPVTPAPAPEPARPVVQSTPPVPAKPVAGTWTEANYPRAQPVLPPPAAGKPVASTAKVVKPKVAAVAKKTKKIAQTTPKPARPAVAANPVPDKLAPPPDETYPRAKPVNPANVVAAPAVMSTLPPARAPAKPAKPVVASAAVESVDPNSLGAQLNPFHQGAFIPAAMNPRLPGVDVRTDGAPAALTSPLGGVTGKANDPAP